MFSLSVRRGAPEIAAREPFDGKSLWLPAAFLCFLIIPFGWIGVFAPAIWLGLVAMESAHGWKKATSFFITGLLMLLVNSGLIPGNEHILLMEPYRDASANLIYPSFRPAKAVIALTIVLFMLVRPQPLKRKDLPWIAVVVAAPIALGGMVLDFHPKLTATIALAALLNFVVVCIAEEGFFRWVLQRGLGLWLKRWPWIATALVTLLFVSLHTGWAASPTMLALVGVAGFGYALLWQLRGSFWACVLAHWGVNLLHMTLLAYPG
ncbi:CPBP family intramembrane glutamic endopeptidase [Microbulbifer agarilyticus]|uniref:CPBP family intramembrane glutamic endopeptidase n=1 Tax=Microbulbifer agarilyticus TaxID=260552 RepID=UPI001C9418CA|nr:CPBP family intramembrane glutamic endopeptidase [Microbulbifer agarilyticus]MBY6190776.1 CPBP family intramembrane metalloprotease [Microbulbifer agarilyticus]MBY6211381.1 CPBP family intramembrane metalloprotease [Microbulbifer agarilyticus]MCA0893602.1 CPBP family intramembrane metalloprotease [Microbulbifer agarilyticus]